MKYKVKNFAISKPQLISDEGYEHVRADINPWFDYGLHIFEETEDKIIRVITIESHFRMFIPDTEHHNYFVTQSEIEIETDHKIFNTKECLELFKTHFNRVIEELKDMNFPHPVDGQYMHGLNLDLGDHVYFAAQSTADRMSKSTRNT